MTKKNTLDILIKSFNSKFNKICSECNTKIACHIKYSRGGISDTSLVLQIKNKNIFKKGHCRALTGKGCQCSRKVKRKHNFCGLHKNCSPSNSIDNRYNFTTYSYNFIIKNTDKVINSNNMKRITYKNKIFFYDFITNLLYIKDNSKLKCLGNINNYNIRFV